VLRFEEPFPVTLALVRAAADALMAELAMDPLAAQQAAMSALFAGRTHAYERDLEIKSVRSQNDRLRKQLDRLTQELIERGVTPTG
jgi:hypothetical protein